MPDAQKETEIRALLDEGRAKVARLCSDNWVAPTAPLAIILAMLLAKQEIDNEAR